MSVYKSNEIINLLEFLKSHFQFNADLNTDIHRYKFFNFGNNYLLNIKENLNHPYIKLNFENFSLEFNMYNPKISTIQPIYCDFIYYSVSNNNCLSFINIKR